VIKALQSIERLPILDLAHRPVEPKLLKQLELTRSWPRALVVRSAFPALEVADMVDLNDMKLVVTVDQENAINGVIAPSIVIYQAVHKLTIAPGLGRFSGVVSEIIRRSPRADFEWLTSRGPDLYWCERGLHLTVENPCSEDHS
jgi:hypothetical protein